MNLALRIIRILPLSRCVIVLVSLGVIYTLFATSKRLQADQLIAPTITVKTKPISTPVNKSIQVVPPTFRSAMSDADHANLMTVLRRFSETADPANLTYFMYWGTLIGSYRHHGRIPWDDDVDIIVAAKQKTQLETMLKSLAPDYLYAKSKYGRWKVFACNSSTLKEVPWKYPFVDVSFFLEDEKLLWDQDPGYKRVNTFQKSDVFPLRRRPFSGMMLPAPGNTLAALKQFNLNKCVSSNYNHSVEQFIPSARRMSLSCSELWDRLPFVFRTKTSHGTNETLKIGTQVISWFVS